MKKVQKNYINKIKERSEANSGKEYRSLWVSVNFATAKDGHIRRIGADAFGIFMVIRAYMDTDSQTAYPSLVRIAYLSGCSVTTVRKKIAVLIEEGWLKKANRIRTREGKYGNTLYKILETDLIRGAGQKGFIEQPLSESTIGDSRLTNNR